MPRFRVSIQYKDGDYSGTVRKTVEAADDQAAEEKAMDEAAEEQPWDEATCVRVREVKEGVTEEDPDADRLQVVVEIEGGVCQDVTVTDANGDPVEFELTVRDLD